jgi:hypothetical protein
MDAYPPGMHGRWQSQSRRLRTQTSNTNLNSIQPHYPVSESLCFLL